MVDIVCNYGKVDILDDNEIIFEIGNPVSTGMKNKQVYCKNSGKQRIEANYVNRGDFLKFLKIILNGLVT